MYNGVKENEQAMLNHMCAAIMEMRVNGSEKYNHICELKLIDIPEPIQRWWGWQRKGKWVRIVWSDSPERDDGYYDVYVDGDSAWGMFIDVYKRIKEIFG